MAIWSRGNVPFPAVDLIRQLCPFTATATADPHGRLSIGYGSPMMPNGHPVAAAPPEGEMMPKTLRTDISQAQAEQLLLEQMPALLKMVAETVAQPVQEYEAAALVSLAHGEGNHPLYNSALINMLNGGRHDLVPSQFPRWSMVRIGVASSVSLSLLRRRLVEGAVFGASDVMHAVESVARLSDAEAVGLKANGDEVALHWNVARDPATTP